MSAATMELELEEALSLGRFWAALSEALDRAFDRVMLHDNAVRELAEAVEQSRHYLALTIATEADWWARVGWFAMALRMRAALEPGWTEALTFDLAGTVLRERFALDLSAEDAAYVAAEILNGYASR